MRIEHVLGKAVLKDVSGDVMKLTTASESLNADLIFVLQIPTEAGPF